MNIEDVGVPVGRERGGEEQMNTEATSLTVIIPRLCGFRATDVLRNPFALRLQIRFMITRFTAFFCMI